MHVAWINVSDGRRAPRQETYVVVIFERETQKCRLSWWLDFHATDVGHFRSALEEGWTSALGELITMGGGRVCTHQSFLFIFLH